MNIEDFPKPHIPEKLPIENLSSVLTSDRQFLDSMIKAEQSLSEFIGYLNNLPNPQILISSLTLQEAVLSSRIEGTVATISDVVQENYATETLENEIKKLKITVALLSMEKMRFLIRGMV